MKMRRFFCAFLLALSCSGMLVVALPIHEASAQAGAGLTAVGATIKLPSTDPRILAARIINVALGVLGLVLVVLILYGGFLYMTAGGEAEKTKKARQVIISAIIGLVIILSAWAITRFVIDRLLRATGEEGSGVTTSGAIGGAGGFGVSGVSAAFKVISITPAGNVPVRNVQVKIVFNKTVDDAGASSLSVRKEGGATVGGTVAVDGQIVTFTPSQTCPPPHADKNCFDANTSYLVNVSGSIRSTSGQTVACGAFGSPCEGKFRTGSLVDINPPSVSLTYPVNGKSISVNSIERLFADATDDSGVATVQFFDESRSLGVDAPLGGTPQKEFSAKIDWTTTAASLGPHTLSVVAKDLDTNTSAKSSVSVMVRSEKCFNGKLDSPFETGIDCGGDPSRPEYCGACAAGACVKDTDCASGTCRVGKCVVQPIISGVSPLNGKRGTFVTISGTNFGFSPGKVVFLGGPGPSDDTIAVAPAACSVPGVTTWKNTEVVVAVPDAAASGPILIENKDSALRDATNDITGPAIPNFVVDTTERPGVCSALPTAGSSGTESELIGIGFGSTASKVRFGGTDLVPTGWVPERARFRVPVVSVGPYPVSVKTSVGESNEIRFTVLEKSFGTSPVIDSIDPSEGAHGQYVTLFGRFFGPSIGKVEFIDAASRVAVGDTSFPAACGSGFWRDDRIVVKLPSKFTGGATTDAGKYKVRLTRSDGAASNDIFFTLNPASKITPGVCAITPALGPIGTKVRVSGEGFSEKPTVTFTSGKAAVVADSFTSQEIDTTVPLGALTGPVSISVGGVLSNKIQFAVQRCTEIPDACSPSEQCCSNGVCLEKGKTCGAVSRSAEYAWAMSTGLIPVAPEVVEECQPGAKPPIVPSPSPWSERAGGNDVPITSAVVMRFTRVLDPTTVNEKTLRLARCVSSSGDLCAKTDPIAVTMSHKPLADGHFVRLVHPPFATNATYLVTVSTAVKAQGVGGATMTEKSACGKDTEGKPLGYCFRFKTTASTKTATIGSVSVVPSPFTMTGAGQTAAYEAVPIDSSNACVILDCSQFTWDWYTGKKTSVTSAVSDPRATIENKDGACEQIGTGHDETGAVPVDVNARVIDSFALIGTAKLFIRFVPPHVESYAPNCQLACSNALVVARFSDVMSAKSFTAPHTVEIAKCKNENCFESELASPFFLGKGIQKIALMPDLRAVHITPTSLFESGAFYRVLLKSSGLEGIRGKNGMPLTGLNHPRGFQWKFRVKTGTSAFCKAQRVDVVPTEKYETQLDTRQLFVATAVGAPDECSADGQEIVSRESAAWESTREDVARLWTIEGSLIDTGAELPPGCSGSCLATGSIAPFGKIAVCGNKIIEMTDSKFCAAGKTPQGFACALLPADAQAGEECEPSVAGDFCDAETCRFRSIKSVTAGGTCGNGTVDVAAGEACDPGLTCKGATSSVAPIADGSSCAIVAAKTACETAGGVCGVYESKSIGCTSGCRNVGASSGVSTCGNGDKGAGEDCDDGNITDGDGCSSQCLHEGSQPLKELYSICGNALLEPGETCERQSLGALFPVGCDSRTCLHLGTISCTSGTASNCCGNGKIEGGEDCDDRNIISGDGCSSSCLLEGSSPAYSDTKGIPSPSFCSNGVLEYGEQCEAGAPSSRVAEKIGFGTGDGAVDPVQLALITGKAKPDADGRMKSDIKVRLEEQDGVATYGLQCGFTREASCSPGYGLDDNGCCAKRPSLVKKYPDEDAKDVCRNVQIKAVWNDVMEPASVVSNFEISLVKPVLGCPAGTREVLAETDVTPGLRSWLVHLWSRFISIFIGDSVHAEKWCTGSVTGQLIPVGTPTSAFVLNLDASFLPETRYRVRFLGDASTSPDPLSDNAIKEKKLGVKTARGVVRRNENLDSGDAAWTFTTGKQICAVNVVAVRDVTDEATPPVPPDVAHPFLFLNKNNTAETRQFLAQAVSLQSGIAVPLSSTVEYAWSWAPWSTSNGTIVTVKNTSPSKDTIFATSQQKNGTAMLTATLDVSKDTVNIPPTKGGAVQGVAPVTVLVCENPWPSLAEAPFRDATDSPNFKPGDLFHPARVPTPLYYNFSFSYCRDAGAEGTLDDLPAMKISQVEQTPLDLTNGILRQYLFTYSKEEDLPKPFRGQNLQADGIGIRIIANPQHLSPQEWYLTRGFTGSPSSREVDGYPAIQDGTTIYVAGANRPKGSTGKIYSNIYLISHNENAKDPTLQIFRQLVTNLTFNTNKEFVTQSNVCVKPTTITGKFSVYTSSTLNGGEPFSCSTDADCLALGIETLHCDSDKLKLIRDTKRLADFQQLASMLETSKVAEGTFGRYPQLSGGTFLQNVSASPWSSWQKELGAVLTTTLPVDPVNRLLTCGQCEKSGRPCQTPADCSERTGTEACKGGTYKIDSKTFVPVWTPDAQMDPQSCWNQKSRVFTCPRIPGAGQFGVSRIYRYQSVENGARYDLGAEFELPPTDLAEWWSPPLAQGTYRCVNPGSFGAYCANSTGNGPDANLCRPCPSGNCKTCQGGPRKGLFCPDAASCADGGKSYDCTDTFPPAKPEYCKQYGGTFTYKNICVNIAVGESGVCGDGIVNTGELCDVGMTRLEACDVPVTKEKGHKLQVCDLASCAKFIDDPSRTRCIADITCGNGRIDKKCSLSGLGCLADADCGSGGGTCLIAEVCDDGSLNGTYGRCNASCSGYAGYCGNSLISPGEVCDEGKDNGVYGGVCGFDCKGPGPFCGDVQMNGTEECDGQTETTQSAICSGGDVSIVGKKTCITNADCGTGGVCGFADPKLKSCVGVKETVTLKDSFGIETKIAYETQHTRSCRKPGDPKQCTFDLWSPCRPKGICGDGLKDIGEECDDGSGNGDTKSCTSVCKKNLCGDGKTHVGVEECDKGADNGKITCTADYDSICLSCNTGCKFLAVAGGYCGDRVKNGPEQCDGTEGLTGITCAAIGYDYGLTPVASLFGSSKKGVCRLYRETNCSVGEGCRRLDDFVRSEKSCSSDSECKGGEGSFKSMLDPTTGKTVEVPETFPAWYALGATCVGDVPSCMSSCSFGGCLRCSDPPDPLLAKTISGTVRDGIYTNQPVPNARVTLLFKGVKIAETITNTDGNFTLKNVNSVSVCNAYRIVVDSYDDNPCTGSAKDRPSCADQPWTIEKVDESVNGGYWAFTSQPFSVATFFTAGLENEDGVIFLLPRVQKYETLVSVNWIGNLSTIAPPGSGFIDAHLILPYAFRPESISTGCDKKNPDTCYSYEICKDPSKLCEAGKSCCIRDLKYNAPGLRDLAKEPYARMYCYQFDTEGEDCTVFNKSPETLKYSRRSSTLGTYDFYIVDYSLKWVVPTRNYTNPLKLRVSVVTESGVVHYEPPVRDSTQYCKNYKAVWHVFSQDAGTGEIELKNELLTKKAAYDRNLTSLGTGEDSAPACPGS